MTDKDFLIGMRILPEEFPAMKERGDGGKYLRMIPVKVDDAELIRRIQASADKEIDDEDFCVQALIADNEYLQKALLQTLELKRQADTDVRVTQWSAFAVMGISLLVLNWAFSVWRARG